MRNIKDMRKYNEEWGNTGILRNMKKYKEI